MNTSHEVLSALGADESARLDALHARLVGRAADEGLLDVVYCTVDSPVGPLLLAATDRGLVRVAFASEDHDVVLARLAQRIGPRILAAPDRLEAVTTQLTEYFTGARTRFELPIDLQLSAGFRREVLEHLPQIAYGHTASYAAVAAGTGRPRAVRAVGTACATNPLPLVLPCHRVVRSDGSMGAYAGGVEAKRTLLDLEAAA
jgi:methylated-DNA-[protein]-cysteine S-methyltransferase